LPTIAFGKTAATKIKPTTKEIIALSICLSSPKTFSFSRIPKSMKNTRRKGNAKSVKIELCNIVVAAISN
jgi:hypothetical protein